MVTLFQALKFFLQVKSYWSQQFQFVHADSECCSCTRVSCGEPQGSVLGPIPFYKCMLPLGNLRSIFEVIQMILNRIVLETTFSQTALLEICIKDGTWITINFILSER